MPKFLVTMNFVEAKQTTFIIKADNEDDVRDGLSELDFNFFEKKCDWLSTAYEPPTIENIRQVNNNQKKGYTRIIKNRQIQNTFNSVIQQFNKAEQDE